MEKLRRCLRCNKLFQSSGPSNRFCKNCKKHNRQLYGGLEAPVMNETDIRKFTERRSRNSSNNTHVE